MVASDGQIEVEGIVQDPQNSSIDIYLHLQTEGRNFDPGWIWNDKNVLQTMTCIAIQHNI